MIHHARECLEQGNASGTPKRANAASNGRGCRMGCRVPRLRRTRLHPWIAAMSEKNPPLLLLRLPLFDCVRPKATSVEVLPRSQTRRSQESRVRSSVSASPSSRRGGAALADRASSHTAKGLHAFRPWLGGSVALLEKRGPQDQGVGRVLQSQATEHRRERSHLCERMTKCSEIHNMLRGHEL